MDSLRPKFGNLVSKSAKSKGTLNALKEVAELITHHTGIDEDVAELKRFSKFGGSNIEKKRQKTSSGKKPTQITPDTPTKRKIPQGHRRNPETDPNIQGSTQAKMPQADSEVHVVPPPRKIAKSHPDYFTVELPMYTNLLYTLSQSGTTINQATSILLNSCYDPLQGSSSGQPLGRDTWAGIYEFYRVLETQVTLIWHYTMGEFGNDEVTAPVNWNGATPVHLLCGYQITDDTADVATTPAGLVEMKHSKCEILEPKNQEMTAEKPASGGNPTNIRRTRVYGGMQRQDFTYRPEQWDYHVTQVSEGETRWTAKDAEPTEKHYLVPTLAYPYGHVTTMPDGSNVKVYCDIYIRQKVQWREVNSTKKRTSDQSGGGA